MIGVIIALLHSLIGVFRPSGHLVLENLALRHQIAVLSRNAKKPRFSNPDRMLWIFLRTIWSRWKGALVILQPQTVVGWHRAGFRLFWRWKSKNEGRPPIDHELIGLIRRMWEANPTWGSPRIRAELAKLGLTVSDSTVRKYRPCFRRPPSQTWSSFLHSHAKGIVAIDFLTVPTATFRILYVFIVLAHDRRRVVHFSVTDSPTAVWTGQEMVNAFPFETAPRFLLRDRDGIYGKEFQHRVASLGMEETLIAPRSPWQNPYVERLIGTLRRECLDHVIVMNEPHLRRVIRDFLEYYHHDRTHRSLDQDCPISRSVEAVEQGKICEFPKVGGLHHRYQRQSA